MMLRLLLVSLALLTGLAAAAPEALAQSTETTTAEQPRRSRSRATTTQARQPSAGQLAARQRMRDCGAEWRGIRGTARAQNRTWRDFSRECLARGRSTETPARRSRTSRNTGSF